MSRREELLELDEDLNARKRELFSQEYMTTKHALLRRIDDVVKRTEGRVSRSPEEDLEGRRYLEAKLGNLREFSDCVRETTLFEVLDEGWCYEFAIDSHGTSLLLRHVSLTEIAGNGHDEWLEVEEYDSRLEVIETRCRLLSVDEFASKRGVAPATIRVWIRRDKIRSAMKTASGWMVPEMAAPPQTRLRRCRVCMGREPGGLHRGPRRALRAGQRTHLQVPQKGETHCLVCKCRPHARDGV